MSEGGAPEVAKDAARAVSPRFSRLMRATTSRFGLLSDPAWVGVAIAACALVATLGAPRVPDPTAATLVAVLPALPLLIALTAFIALGGARARVVAWLDSLPFALINMNGVLNGVAVTVRVCFHDTMPPRDAIGEACEQIHNDVFPLEADGDGREIEIRIGVFDRKLNPHRSNHERYLRVIAIVEQVLVPLHEEHPIASVWIT